MIFYEVSKWILASFMLILFTFAFIIYNLILERQKRINDLNEL